MKTFAHFLHDLVYHHHSYFHRYYRDFRCCGLCHPYPCLFFHHINFDKIYRYKICIHYNKIVQHRPTITDRFVNGKNKIDRNPTVGFHVVFKQNDITHVDVAQTNPIDKKWVVLTHTWQIVINRFKRSVKSFYLKIL